MNRLLSLIIIILGIASLVLGVFFISQGISKNTYIANSVKAEKITLGLTPAQVASGQIDSSPDQLQAASEKVAADRHNIAPTYTDLLGGKNFNPADPKPLTWAQALNLESSLNAAVLAFGVAQIAEGVGAFMVIVAVALVLIGIVFWRLSGRNRPSILTNG